MHIKQGHNVSVPQLGIFKLKTTKARPARKGINPFTKEPTTFKAKPASKKIRFFPSKALKEGLK